MNLLSLNIEVWGLNFMIRTTNYPNFSNNVCDNDSCHSCNSQSCRFSLRSKICHWSICLYVILSSCKNMSLKYMSLCHSVFMQFVSFVVLSLLSSCKNMSLKYMSLCHSVFSSHSVCQSFSQSVNQKGINSVRINGFLACKRCPLRRLLTPFWSPIKHLLKSVFATTW